LSGAIDVLDGVSNIEQGGKFFFVCFLAVSNTLMVKKTRGTLASLKPHLGLQWLKLEGTASCIKFD